ncbi:MAG: acetate--CoA ligase family protein, partial [Pseudomonadota bacterium]
TETELWADRTHLLVPAPRDAIRHALLSLRCAPLLQGYRGRAPANIEAVLDAIDAVQAYVAAQAEQIEEVEINPLLCTPDRAVAVDALIRKAP